MRRKITQQGFTLIELLVVIAVIGILAAVIMASLNDARAKARDAKRLADLKQVQTALELYRNDNNGYPIGNWNSLSVWTNNLNNYLVTPGYLASVPVDPKGVDIYRLYSNYSGTYTCAGKFWQDYEYVITFDLEKANSSIPNTNWSTNAKCFPGPLK